MKIKWLAAILLLSFFAHLPTFQNGFMNSWDSAVAPYIIGNSVIQELTFDQIIYHFTHYYDGHYHPLTMISLSIDQKIGGEDPFIFHVTTMILHLLNTACVFFLVFALSKRVLVAIVTALLFGVHPLHVESISWLSERKNVLFTFFFLSSLIAYVRYAIGNLSGKGEKRTLFYFLALGLFLLSLFSKSQAVSLSLTLIAVDYFLGRNLLSRMVILEKVPFFILSFIFGVTARYVQQLTWDFSENPFSLSERLVFAIYAYMQYFFKLLIPLNLSAKYMYPERVDGNIPFEFWCYILPFAVFIGVLFFSIFRKKKNLAFGLLFFFSNIFLLLKLSKVPFGDYVMADRYTYVPSIGIFFIFSVGLQNLIDHRKEFQNVFIFCVAIYTALLIGVTYERTKVWQNDETFYTDLSRKSPTSFDGWYELAKIREKQKKYKEVVDLYSQFIAIKPGSGYPYIHRGRVRNDYLGETQEAIVDFSLALSTDITNDFRFAAFFHRSIAYAKLKSLKLALEDCEHALNLIPKIEKPDPILELEANALREDILRMTGERN